MAEITVKGSDPDLTFEYKLLTSMIISDKFLKEIQYIFSPNLLRDPVIGLVGQWTLDYYKKYDKAPNSHLKDIFDDESGILRDEQSIEFVQKFLIKLSRDYADGKTEINDAYLLDKAEKYLKKRSLIHLAQQIKTNAESMEITKGESLIKDYRKITRPTSDGVDLFTDELLLEKAYSEDEESLFVFPGALGELMNSQMCRDAFVGFMAPEKRGKCLIRSKDCKIIMSDGSYISNEKLFQERRTDIVSFNESSQKFEQDEIIDFWENGSKPVYKVKTRTGRSVEITDNHPLLTPNGWKDLSELKVKDFIAVPKELPIFGTEEMEEHKIKILAYIIAEGNTTNGAVGFTNAEKAIQEDFNNCVQEMGCSVRGASNGIDFEVTNGKENRGKHNKNFVRSFLQKHKVWDKYSYEKTIPDSIFRLRKDLIRLFLKILFTCDGSVYTGTIEYCSTSEELAKGVHHLLTRFGIVSVLRFSENGFKGAWIVSIGSYEYMKKFMDEIGFVFSKQEKALSLIETMSTKSKSFLDKIPNKIASNIVKEIQEIYSRRISTIISINDWDHLKYQVNKGCPIMRQSFKNLGQDIPIINTLLSSQILWDEIVEISYQGEKETVDLTVKKNHNFIADNILVHNTWFLIELMMRVLRSRKRVVYFSIGDMTETQIKRRTDTYLAKRGWKEKKFKTLLDKFYPIMDCYLNQIDKCNEPMRKRKSKYILDKKEGRKPDPEKTKHIPCIACPNIIPTYWFKQYDPQEVFTKEDARMLGRKFAKVILKKSHKVKAYANRQASVSDLKTQLDMWEEYDDFIADVIIIDYADNLAPEKGTADFRQQQNIIWQSLRALSQEKRCLVITATQSDAQSYSAKTIGLKHFSEDKRKYAHVTAMYGLNQDDDEKTHGILRINPVVVREEEFDRNRSVAVMQNLNIGRPHLGSYWHTDYLEVVKETKGEE
jgi:intein/homing endonuclease